jgi:hypothetical protein
MPPASPNARPSFSHVLVFLLAVITFSISYAVSSLAATVQTATNGRALQEIRPTFRRGYQGLLLPKTSRILVQGRAIHRRDPAGSSTEGRPTTAHSCWQIPCADYCQSHVLPDRVTGLATMSIRTEVTSMPGRR